MRKIIKNLLILTCLGIVISVLGDSLESTNEKKIRELLQEKKQLLLQMHYLRIKLIKDDPELKKLHSKIMTMYRELGIKLDKKPEMKQLVDQYRKFSTGEELLLQMHLLRIKLIDADPELKKLHNKTAAMYREMGIRLDNKPAMKQLLTRSREVERTIIKLSKKSNEDL